ncbi:MAG: alanine dehydrogenase [Burkholderiales bacterium]|jgi:alanine dehydrogenase|nr:alanine dehydrogenase [Burkholderiales bacterium]
MRVGVPREIKTHEYRVGLTPTSVRELAAHGHEVIVEAGAGAGIGVEDAAYEKAGGRIGDPWQAELVVKVKEPQAAERKRLKRGQVLFAYLHLAPDVEQTRDLVETGAVCIAYETVTRPGGGLPLLAPMSEVAGRMAIQVGASCLEKARGGMGILLGGVPGVPPAKITILGAGVAGSNAARLAVGAGARVYALDRSLEVLRKMESEFGARVVTVYSSRDAIEHHVLSADLVIGAVLVPGAAAPKLVSHAVVKAMKPGSVVVDIAIDQGGCFETSRPTTHADPTFVVDGVVHYCVTNMPGAVPRTSTYALNNATLPFALALADKGWQRAAADDEHLRNGLNVALGKVTHGEVAAAVGAACVPAAELLG